MVVTVEKGMKNCSYILLFFKHDHQKYQNRFVTHFFEVIVRIGSCNEL